MGLSGRGTAADSPKKRVSDMWNRHYDVTMRTPIGLRYGTMAVTVDGCKVRGTLHILKRANPFAGNIDESGQCSLRGELTTLTRTIPYEATGWIARESLTLRLKGAVESFDLSGKAVRRSAQREERRA